LRTGCEQNVWIMTDRERERIKNYVIRRCMLCTYFSPICYDGSQIEEDKMGGACSTNGEHDKFTLSLCVENVNGRDHLTVMCR
jgi:hypothetical protein